MSNPHDVIIVGAGLSGLATAHFLKRKNSYLDIVTLEKDERAGGAVRSFQAQGFLAEWGPHGFLDNNPASRELLHDTGLDKVAQKAPLGSFVRYVCHRGRLEQLPQKPQALLATPLLSLSGKLRLLGDLVKSPAPDGLSVGEWAAYRFGKEVLPLVDAAVTGTFAGDYTRLSMDAVMPGARGLEKEYGSLLKGLIKKKKQGKKDTSALPAMTSFPQGMEQLTTTLAAQHTIRYATTVNAIRHDTTWQVTTNSGTLTAKHLVLALPVNQALALLAPYQPPQTSIPTSTIATVVMGFGDTAQVPYGFGYLAPEKEDRFALGAMFSTRMFPGRAPDGKVLLEALVGGRRHPERLELDDAELVTRVYEDLKELIPLPDPPCFSQVLRTNHGIPQLEENHLELLAWKKKLEEKSDGLFICGFGWDGIGMNDMMKSAQSVAEGLLTKKAEKSKPEVKPVYF